MRGIISTRRAARISLERTPCISFMEILNRQFGLIIAYVLPGFVALAGIAPLVPAVAGWLEPTGQGVGLGPPVYALLAATAAGMTVSCFRWLLIDQLHAMTGLGAPVFNARALEERPSAFTYLVESHYRYYQFYANTLVSVVWTYGIHRWLRTSPLLRFGSDVAVLILCAVLFAGSRDALEKYRSRCGQLVGQIALRDLTEEAMTNGIDHNQGSGNTSKPATGQKGPNKPKVAPKPSEHKPTEKQAPRQSAS
jgi:hypothetical protein